LRMVLGLRDLWDGKGLTGVISKDCVTRSGAALLRFNVGTEYGVHTGQVALAARFEPIHDVPVKAEVNRCFARRQDYARRFPEVTGEGFSARSARASGVFAALARNLDFAKGIPHDSGLLLHLCSPSGR